MNRVLAGYRKGKEMEHFNNLTPPEQERLSLLLEEMGEAIQIIGKIQRHGYKSCHPNAPGVSNKDLLITELGHVQFAISLMVDEKDFTEFSLKICQARKFENVYKWLHHNFDHEKSTPDAV